MERRQFIGATAAVLASAVLPRIASASNSPVAPIDLNWQSEIINTVAHNPADRMPVVTGVSIKPGGSEIAIAGDDHFVGIYDMKSGAYTHQIDAHRDWVRSAVYAPSGDQLATGGNDRALRVWANGNYETPLLTRNLDAAIIKLAYSHDSAMLATVGFEKTMRIFDAQTGRVAQRLACPCPDNHAVAFSADGKMIAAGGRSGDVRVWEVASGKVVSEVKAHRRRIRSLQFTQAGQLISASDDQMVKIIDPKAGTVDNSLPRHPSKLFTAQLLPNDMIATGGSDNQIRIWDLGTQAEVGVLHGHTGTVTSMDAEPGVLVSGSFDTHVRIWQAGAAVNQPLERQADQQWRALK